MSRRQPRQPRPFQPRCPVDLTVPERRGHIAFGFGQFCRNSLYLGQFLVRLNGSWLLHMTLGMRLGPLLLSRTLETLPLGLEWADCATVVVCRQHPERTVDLGRGRRRQGKIRWRVRDSSSPPVAAACMLAPTQWAGGRGTLFSQAAHTAGAPATAPDGRRAAMQLHALEGLREWQPALLAHCEPSGGRGWPYGERVYVHGQGPGRRATAIMTVCTRAHSPLCARACHPLLMHLWAA